MSKAAARWIIGIAIVHTLFFLWDGRTVISAIVTDGANWCLP